METFVRALIAFGACVPHAGAAQTAAETQRTLQGEPKFDGKVARSMHQMLVMLDEVPKCGEAVSAHKGKGHSGIDFRGCWGDTVDLEGNAVCGNQALKKIKDDLVKPGRTFGTNTSGKGGAAIVVDIPGFIVKSAKVEEYNAMMEFLPAYGKMINTRAMVNSHRTALAPICAVLNQGSKVEQWGWVIMRTVMIPGAEKSRIVYNETNFAGVKSDRVSIEEYDLKGPDFRGAGDGKTYWGTVADRGKKDYGFNEIFPKGINLRGCGSRHAVIVLGQDSRFLREWHFTDYSLLATVYTPDFNDESPPRRDFCNKDKKPVFPLILEGFNGHDGSPVRFAAGIIDYLETFSNSCWGELKAQCGSTMLKPTVYQHAWVKMFPTYFSLPSLEDPIEGHVCCAIEGFDTTGTGDKFQCEITVDVGTILKIVGTRQGKFTFEAAPGQPCTVDAKFANSLAGEAACLDETKVSTKSRVRTLRFMRTIIRRLANRAMRRFVN